MIFDPCNEMPSILLNPFMVTPKPIKANNPINPKKCTDSQNI
jgi:hypothetical protein